MLSWIVEVTKVNEKFWDLKKSKQDNMINGSLKVFAAGGFRHASTDEIVAEAEVSKGLLFHYFYSKAGVRRSGKRKLFPFSIFTARSPEPRQE